MLRVLLVLALLPAAGCAAKRYLMPTPTIYACAEDDPFADVPALLRTPSVDLLYVTDRRPVPGKKGAEQYDWNRSPSVAFGRCVVELGEDMTWDALVDASRAAKRRRKVPMSIGEVAELGRFAPTPAPVILVGGKLEIEPQVAADRDRRIAEFQEELDRRLAVTPRKEVYVFIHGYANTFADAAYALAEVWHFLGREGVPILYTWPAGSHGLLRSYTRDRESGEFTIFHLKGLFRVLGANPNVERVNVISHSRGTDVATSAFRELLIEARRSGDAESLYKFGRLVLAAPDLDYDVITQRIVAERLQGFIASTVYVSATDEAIGIADWLFNSERRLGQLRPEDIDPNLWETLEDVRTLTIVDARIRHSDKHGHSYFRTNPSCSSDLILFLRYHAAAGTPERPLAPADHGFWILKEPYPCKPGDS